MGIIEQLISQQKFESEYQKGYISLMYLSNAVDDMMQLYFKKYGVTAQQYNALRILRGQHPNPTKIGVIKERMIDRNSDTSRIVERLRKIGLVKRLPSSTDRRAVDVIITIKGLNLLKKIDLTLHTTEKFLRVLGDAEIQDLNNHLDKMLRSFTPKS
jgi:MarR family transcriptional regulator, multiple gene regulator MgrA